MRKEETHSKKRHKARTEETGLKISHGARNEAIRTEASHGARDQRRARGRVTMRGKRRCART